MNNVGGTTAVRTNLIQIGSERNYGIDDRDRRDRRKSENYEIITPIGILASWDISDYYNFYEYNYPEYGLVGGEKQKSIDSRSIQQEFDGSTVFNRSIEK